MAEDKISKDRNQKTVTSRDGGPLEKPLGRQVSKEEQKASRKFLTNEQKPSGTNSGANPHTPVSKSNQDA